MDVRNKVAIVTEASLGIGLATAKLLTKQNILPKKYFKG